MICRPFDTFETDPRFVGAAQGRDAFIAAVAEAAPKPAEMEALLRFNHGRMELQ